MSETIQSPETPAAPAPVHIDPQEQARRRVGLLVGKVAEFCDVDAIQIEEFLIAMKILLAAQFAANRKSLLPIWVKQLEAETKARRGMKAREKVVLEQAGKDLPATLAEIQEQETAAAAAANAPDTPPEPASHAEDVIS